VSRSELRAAFEDIRRDEAPPGGDPRARIRKALADALDVSESEVAEAFEEVRAEHESEAKARREAFAKALAEELGIEADRVTSALEKLRPAGRGTRHLRPPRAFRDGAPGRLGPGGPGGPPGAAGGPPPLAIPHGPGARDRLRRAPRPAAFLSELAEELGVKRSELRAALVEVRAEVKPARRPFRGGPPPGLAEDLAEALGKDTDDVEAALEEVHSQIRAAIEQRRDRLAAELAERLDLPVEKVKEALAAGPFGRHGPPPGP
jgi:hypothetical protein